MMIILILLLASAMVGFMIAPRHNIKMVAVSSPILALTAVTAAWLSDFSLLASITITFACVTVSQIAYLLLLWFWHAGVLSDEPSHN